MEDSLEKRPDGKLGIRYPFNERAWSQVDNSHQARQIFLKVEESLRRKGLELPYHEEFRKAMELGSMVELKEEEMAS